MLAELKSEEAEQILRLRALVARAAQKDSLAWWEDESLTIAGGFILDKLFLDRPDVAGLKLALESTRVRYQAVFSDRPTNLHLFRLDQTGKAEHEISQHPLESLEVHSDPIEDLQKLRDQLLAISGKPTSYQVMQGIVNGRLEIMLDRLADTHPTVAIAQALAWATLEGDPGSPVFPYCLANS